MKGRFLDKHDKMDKRDEPLFALVNKDGRFLLVSIEESSEKIERILRSIKSAIILGTISSFLWVVKGPKDLPGIKDLEGSSSKVVLDKTPWILDKHSEYSSEDEDGGDKSKIVYVPILRREISNMTAYVPEDSRQTDDDPEHAACGKYGDIVKKGINIIAVSRDIFFDKKAQELLGKRRPLCGLPALVRLKDGSEVKGIIMDTMNPRYEKRADLGISKVMHGNSIEKAREKAFEFGNREAKEIIVFLPVRKEALVEGLAREKVRGYIKRLLEGALTKYRRAVDKGDRVV